MNSRLSWVIALLWLAIACATPTERRSATGEGWSLHGSWTDACCCKISCPCLFGSKPTEGFCEGASLLEIESGHHGDVELDGLRAVATYRVGKWTKIYVSDRASPEQVEALGELVPRAMPFLKKGPVKSVQTAPVSVSRDGDTTRYSVPETSVEMVVMRGANGEPIKLQNLPVKGTPFPKFHDHTQCRATELVHDSPDGGFRHAGRNGFASKVDLVGS